MREEECKEIMAASYISGENAYIRLPGTSFASSELLGLDGSSLKDLLESLEQIAHQSFRLARDVLKDKVREWQGEWVSPL